MKTYVMGTYLKRLVETLPMSTHNIYFQREMRKLYESIRMHFYREIRRMSHYVWNLEHATYKEPDDSKLNKTGLCQQDMPWVDREELVVSLVNLTSLL